MKITITGSGGFRRTPRPGCHCDVCQEAREKGTQRLGSSLFIHDENILFDTPEEIAAELENASIQKIDHLFFTHWHPDHTMGARILETMNTHGVDSFAATVSAIMQGSTETTFYVLAVYFGSVGIKKVRHALACALLADLAGITTAIFAGYLFFY